MSTCQTPFERTSPTLIFSPSEGPPDGTATAVARSPSISIFVTTTVWAALPGSVDCAQPPRLPNVFFT